ncbi:GRRM system radical SAM/SPASM domain protein [Bradyrhizobium diazoefficiens]|nr:cyclophane-forming radical SAM/SPASM peptide maturase GrrM/OscB [Bradyrhizobium diazoefficiens]MBR0931701.1 GRRM system radical SAM/SPASM domain protein [Bradyrhizobium diazoefficiens]
MIVLQPTPYCNINCEYCYLGNRNDRRVMSTILIDAIRDKVFSRIAPDASPTIVWHAGEPTIVPVKWYEQAYEKLERAVPRGATFALQTNGVSISDEWVDFLISHPTRVGFSIDGPQRFHDARRKTRSGGPTWSLVMRNLARLQSAGIYPNVISVLHPECLSAADEFYRFYKDNHINLISFSIDEAEGANAVSSFEGFDYKAAVVNFIARILALAFSDGYSLHVREVERIAHVLTDGSSTDNEQVKPWDVLVVAANGDVTSFSPEFMELRSVEHNNFCFGNILRDDFDDIANSAVFRRTRDEIQLGVDLCRRTCRYFHVCGGGAPSNKMFENHSLGSSETSFCRLSTQAAADAFIRFLHERSSDASHGRLQRTSILGPD